MNIAEQNNKCIRVSIEQVRTGDYSTIVVKNLDAQDDSNRYIWTTKCPNWNGNDPEIGQEGFMTYTSIVAGRDKWYNKSDQQWYDYRYTANYFLDFVPITHVVLGGRVVSTQELIVT